MLNRRLWATLSRLLCIVLRRRFGVRREVDVELGERERESGDAERESIGVVDRPSHNIEPNSHVERLMSLAKRR